LPAGTSSIVQPIQQSIPSRKLLVVQYLRVTAVESNQQGFNSFRAGIMDDSPGQAHTEYAYSLQPEANGPSGEIYGYSGQLLAFGLSYDNLGVFLRRNDSTNAATAT